MAEKAIIKYLSGKNLKLTPQRKLILEVFLNQGGHVSSEELYDIVKARNPGIGQATVYRTLKLFSEAGIAEEVRFGDGVSRYERKDSQNHHDHIICEKCFRQVEFSDPTIEDLQEKQARKHGFDLISHRMVLYGVCSDCRE
ncbi:MAG: transcriptional repressor [bacterium]|nr:MAG: transcriptional repressor [bacterium]